jgi:VIT1/CCC1 family predicted Fe2+/Mn2+ transporter
MRKLLKFLLAIPLCILVVPVSLSIVLCVAGGLSKVSYMRRIQRKLVHETVLNHSQKYNWE